jgi:hypothetical protein
LGNSVSPKAPLEISHCQSRSLSAHERSRPAGIVAGRRTGRKTALLAR